MGRRTLKGDKYVIVQQSSSTPSPPPPTKVIIKKNSPCPSPPPPSSVSQLPSLPPTLLCSCDGWYTLPLQKSPHVPLWWCLCILTFCQNIKRYANF